MNAHSLLDVLSVGLAAVPTRRMKFFRDGVESPTLRELVRTVRLDVPRITGEGRYEVRADTAAGELDPAFEIVRWRGARLPTLLFHHGNNERPFDRGFFSKNTLERVIGNARDEFPANLIVLRAPFHRSIGEYQQHVARLADFAAMLATSACLIEHLQAWSRAQGGAPVVVSGISLGGWATNLHRAYFNSADAYAPLLAGAALDHVFASSVYRRLTARSARENPEALRRVLNFEQDFARVPDDNVFPLLARQDAIIVYDRQKECYGDRPITVLQKGHVTAALATRALRRHLLGVLGGSG
jgi:hypothetical protein